MGKLSSRVLLGVLLTLLLAGPEPLSGQIGLQEVTRLRFRGNDQFPDEALASSINTRVTECRSVLLKPFCMAGADFSLEPYFLNEREFMRDHARVRLFYYLRGFRETAVDTIVDRTKEGEVQITFEIQEGNPILVSAADFRWMGEPSDSSVLEDLPLRVGEPFSVVALGAAQDTIEARFRNRGYPGADALLDVYLPVGTHEAEVAFNIYPGPLTRIGPISIEILPSRGGEPSMEEAVVRRLLPFREGDIFREDVQFEWQRTLYNLDIIRFVNFEPDSTFAVDSILPIPGPGAASTSGVDSIVPFRIRVQEDDVHRVRTGGGLSTAECFNTEASWSSLNFFGGARRLQVTGRVANLFAGSLQDTPLCSQAGIGEWGGLTGLISVDFTQPWFFSPRNFVSASLFVEQQSIPGSFVREAVGMNFGLSRTLSASTSLGVSMRPQYSSLSAAEVFFCSAYLVCSPEEIALLQGASTLSPVGFSFARDRRNEALNPTRGYSTAVDLEYAGAVTGSDFRYTRVVSEATWHTQSRTGWVLGARLRGGWVRPGGFQGLGGGTTGSRKIVYPEKRLFAGGPNSVRGFGQNRLGPRVLYLEDVDRLYDPGKGGVCSPAEVADLSCDPGGIEEKYFFPSPTGGTSLLEGSLEVRFPLVGRLWEGATFLDFGQVWDEDATPTLGDLQLTPGIGVRFFSPIGPIRVDLGYRFAGGEELLVVTKKIEFLPGQAGPTILDDLVVMQHPVLWRGGLGRWDAQRFQFHFSIGQAF